MYYDSQQLLAKALHYQIEFFTIPTLMEMITSTESEQYTVGVAQEVVKKLFRKYRPDDTISNVEAEADLG